MRNAPISGSQNNICWHINCQFRGNQRWWNPLRLCLKQTLSKCPTSWPHGGWPNDQISPWTLEESNLWILRSHSIQSAQTVEEGMHFLQVSPNYRVEILCIVDFSWESLDFRNSNLSDSYTYIYIYILDTYPSNHTATSYNWGTYKLIIHLTFTMNKDMSI